jgi:RHS repeat-associated protein
MRTKTMPVHVRFSMLILLVAWGAQPAHAQAAGVAPQWVPPAFEVSWDSGTYKYDDTGNIAAIGHDKYAYDGANRLRQSETNARGVMTPQLYTYDRYGNLTHVATGTLNQTFTVGTTNRVQSICQAPAPCESWTYDARGNVTVMGTASFTWDALNVMTELHAGDVEERYLYDASDERIATVSMSGSSEVLRRWTLRDPSNRVTRAAVQDVASDSWTQLQDYVHRDGALLASYEGPTATTPTRHYHVDHLGTPRLITDAGRRKLSEEFYLPFGSEAPGTEVRYLFQERMRFTGHERDGAGQPSRPVLDYMHARYYGSVAGRFLSVDPGGFDPKNPQSWNRYAYVMNNPMKAIDPDGRETFLVIYGNGELSPQYRGQSGDVGRQFEIAATTRAAQIRKSDAFNAATDQVFTINASNADEFFTATNMKYSSGKIEGLEVFSHSWYGGLNLGGEGDRGVRADNIGRIDKGNLAPNASATLWGCNSGCPAPQGGKSFAQQLSNALGMTVRAHTGPTEFNKQGKGSPPMVPSNPARGAMRIFKPEDERLLRVQ